MSGKSKFQISRSLDEKIKRVINKENGCDSEFSEVSSAYILGFNYGNVTNYVGLTQDYLLHHAVLPVVGLVYLKTCPSDEDIKSSLKSVQEFSSSPDGLGRFKSDKNEHLFLIYSIDNDTSEVKKRVFDSLTGAFLAEQPKLSVLDEAKIYNHSAIVKLNLVIQLSTKEDSDSVILEAKKLFTNDSKGIKLHLTQSNFSTGTSKDSKALTETLYDHLEAPNEVLQMGDYLPQMTKKDKEKLVEKWRNKVKGQRVPMEFLVEHDSLSTSDENAAPDCYRLNLESYIYLHVNDTLSKSFKAILFSVRNRLDLLRESLKGRNLASLEPNEVKSCTFKPHSAGHLIPAIYLIKDNANSDYQRLAEIRQELHLAHLLPMDQPVLRYSQRLSSTSFTNEDEQAGYLCNVHTSIVDNSGIKSGTRDVIEGTYTYHHYLQDRASDSGWGCAYRSLQTIISWFKHQGYIYSADVELREPKLPPDQPDKTSSLRRKLNLERRVPTHEEIQSVLVDVGDKQPSFVGSQKWIGSQEVCYVLNHLYNLDSKFISVSSGSELVYKARDLGQHFRNRGAPVMIGGGVLAHTIIGVDFNEKNGDVGYLILDPHYTGGEDLSTVTKKGWCGWKKNSFWDKNAFYNLCLPQVPKEI